MQKFRRAAQNFFLLTIFLATTIFSSGCGEDAPKGEVQTKAAKGAVFEDVYKNEDT